MSRLTRLSCAIFATFFFVMPPAFAEQTDYLRGYIDALLALRYAGYEVRIEYLDLQRRELTLTVADCLAPQTRLDIESDLVRSGKVDIIGWRLPESCLGTADAAPVMPRDDPATASIDVVPLPTTVLFRPLIADPRQPQFSTRYHHYTTTTDTFNAASVSFGDYFPFASGFLGSSGISQIGLQGAVFALFNLDSDSYDLINADYWIGVPVSYRKERWSFLGRLYHQSSHLGDEFLLGNPGVDRINLSYEDFEAFASYDWKRWRFYTGGGYIFHSEPELEPWHGQGGVEYSWPDFFKRLNLVAAADFQAEQELDWRMNRSYQLGVAFGREERQVRLMLEHYRGFSPNGQFYRDRLRYSGVGLYFDF
jgi:hypothetical protein